MYVVLTFFRVDGMDVVSVREAIRFAREYAIAKGPLVMVFYF